jgi:hypothetical protein
LTPHLRATFKSRHPLTQTKKKFEGIPSYYLSLFAISKAKPWNDNHIIMRLILAYYYSFLAAVGSLVGSAVNIHAAEPQIALKDRSYYAYGYEGDTTEGAPNG